MVKETVQCDECKIEKSVAKGDFPIGWYFINVSSSIATFGTAANTVYHSGTNYTSPNFHWTNNVNKALHFCPICYNSFFKSILK